MVVDIQNVGKKFGSFQALDDLNLSVKKGEVLGFLGPNGAGKSTTIRIILGLLKATSGQVSLFDQDPWDRAPDLHKRLAYVPGDVSLWPNLTGGEAIDLLGRLRNGFDERRRQDLIERFELDPTKKSRTYSKGNRQKVAIIAALCSEVELLILDEPTSGLDPLMEDVFQEEILKEKKKGTTILLSSHIMSEVEVLADRISIIRQGQITQTGTLEELRGQTKTTIVATIKMSPERLTSMPGLSDLIIKGNKVSCKVKTEHLGQVIEVLSGYGIESLVSQPPSLEELFLKHYNQHDEFKVKEQL